MVWKFHDRKPIYNQIIDFFKVGILSGEYGPGSKILSVRELAEEARVNPNTMQKAMSELEKQNLIFAQSTVGRFITEDDTLIAKIREEYIDTNVSEFCGLMQKMGYEKDEVMNKIDNNYGKGI